MVAVAGCGSSSVCMYSVLGESTTGLGPGALETSERSVALQEKR